MATARRFYRRLAFCGPDVLRTVVLLIVMATFTSAIDFPPSLIEQPKELIIYRPGSTVTLPCAATGHPRPTYKWKRNQAHHRWNTHDKRIRLSHLNGTVTIEGPKESEDGWYQCSVRNKRGTALTNLIRLQRAYIRNIKSVKREVVGVIGRNLTVTCKSPESFPPPTIQWLYEFAASGGFPTPQQFVEESPRMAMDLQGNLLFSSVQEEDAEKIFTCSATNRFLRFTVHGEPVRLKLLPPPNDQSPTRRIRLMYHSQRQIIALANQTVRVRCFFEGAPTPIIRWTKDGMDGLPRGARVMAKGVELIFIRFQRHHTGTYRCHGSNNVDRIGETADVVIKMHSKPKWLVKPKDHLLPVNSSYEFRCEAKGVPKTHVEWSVNGVHINGYIDNNKFFTGNKKLILNDLKVTDTAVIQCNVSNVHGFIFANAYVNVLKSPPEFKRRPQARLKSPQGRRTMLYCETYSAPRAQVQWFQNSRRLILSDFPNRGKHVTPEGNLAFEEAEPGDSGRYRCEASNKFGTVKAQGRLTITRKTTITTPLSSVRIEENQEAKFHCQATTDFMEVINLSINWFKDGKPIEFGVNPRFRRVKGNGETLVIHRARPSDTGTIECMATNRLDEDWSNATLLVRGRPDPPSGLFVDCRSRRSQHLAYLRWTAGADNNAVITRYDVQFALVRFNVTKEAAKAQWLAAEVVGDGLSATPPQNSTLVRLRPWLNYTFRVSAHNTVGGSNPSEASKVHCGLPPAAPSKNPRDLRVSGTKPKELAVNWTPMSPLDQNGPGLVYHLTVACLTCDNMPPKSINKTTVTDWRQDHMVFRHLIINGKKHEIETYKRYRVAIKSENKLGESSASAIAVKGYSGEDRPLTKPSDLRVVENADPKSHLVRLIWKKPDKLDEKAVRGRFRGYRVRWCNLKMSIRQCEREMQFKDILNDDTTHKETAPAGYVSVTLSSLPGLVRLKIWVCVINTHYCGQPSNTVEVETKEGVPGPVSEFNMVSMGTTHLDFEWAKPLQVNGRLIGYQLGILKMDGLKNGEGMIKKFPPIRDREQLSDRIIGLLPNTQYRVYIWARTRQGNGQGTHLDVRTANVNEQSKPKFRVHSVTGNSLNVSLLPQIFESLPVHTTDATRQPYEFYVEYQKMGSSTWEQTRTEYGPRRWMMLTGLDSDTTYFLRVVGGPNAVQSRSSDAVQVRTEELSGVESLFASGLIWLVVLGCAVLCLGVFLVGLCYFRHKRLKYARGKPLPTQESAEKALEQNDYTMPEQITRLPGSGTLQRPMRDFNNHHDTLYMTKLGSSLQEDPNEMATVNGRGNGYGYTSLTKSPVNTIPTSFV